MRIKHLFIGGIVAAAMMASGCELFPLKESAVTNESVTPTEEPAVTEVPEALPTEAPEAVTPIPTSTPAPRLIGTKTTQSKFVFLTNSIDQPLREVYLKVTGTEDWGKNLVPNESTVKVSETVQMFYTSSDNSKFDMKVVDKRGNSYAIYEVDLSDMDSASFRVNDGSASLTYMSLSTKTETSTGYSETLAQNYDTDWETFNTDSSNGSADGNIDYSTADAPTEYDPYADYSAYEGNPNYGYYNDNGTWISYY